MGAIEDRIREWKNRLLDLSRRNPLLYFGRSRLTRIQIKSPDPFALLEQLAGGRRLDFAYITQRDLFQILATTNGDPNVPSVREGDLETDEDPRDLQRKLDRLRGSARGALEEQGINILYLALGFLEWRESDAAVEAIRSPVVLLPVSIRYRRGLPYQLESLDDEITDNPALRYRLQADFGLTLPDPPVWNGENGRLLREYLLAVEEAVHGREWRVAREAWLSTFSFESLVLFRDIADNEDHYRTHEVLRWLAGEDQPAAKSAPAFDDPDVAAPAADLFPVLDADDSQLEVLLRARSGQHLVVHGPPGTGKSQTIANLIAQSMRDGKRILFVSRKMAALEVVFDRLTEAGLGDLCLELHSHRANRQNVLAQLRESLERGSYHGGTAGDFERLQELRTRLNAYARTLRTPIDGRNRTPRQMYLQGASLLAEAAVRAHFPTNPFDISLDEERRFVESIDGIARMAAVFDSQDSHPWRGASLREVSQDRLLEIGDTLTNVRRALASLENSWNALQAITQIGPAESLTSLPSKVRLAEHLSRAPWLPEGLVHLRRAQIPPLKGKLRRAAELKATLDEALAAYRAVFRDSVLALEYETIADLSERFASAFYASWRKSFSGRYRQDARLLRPHLLESRGARRDFPSLRDGLAALEKFLQTRDELQNLVVSISAALGELIEAGISTDWQDVLSVVDWYQELLRMESLELLPVPTAVTGDNAALKASASAFVNLYSQEKNRIDAAIEVITGIFPTGFDGVAMVALPWNELTFRLQEWSTHIRTLPDWCQFRRALDECRQCGLDEFLEDAKARGVTASGLGGALRRALTFAWIDEAERRFPILGESTRRIDDLRDEFKILDRQLRMAASETTKQRATVNRPSIVGAHSRTSEVGLLRHHAGLTRPRIALRELLPKLPTLLPALKPCLLMSPLSVATYLPLGRMLFDLVIFDEASQIPPEEAVGAIARGKQVIVAGDEKQLPPTTFFHAVVASPTDDDDDSLPLTDSILEECIPIFPEADLIWHYRSRNESLIAFSNHEFYGGKLITFPSNFDESEDLGVKHLLVEGGIFDRGASKTNRIEARFVAETVIEQMKTAPSKSIGVIPMSAAQQEAIEHELYRLRQENPDLEDLFSEDRPDRFFVKNLERVQGDERDIIISSLGYSRDATGNMYMQFGPLSRPGGQRRLNVAATRARDKTILVSSVQPGDLDLSRLTSGKDSVALLQRYMEYMRSGGVLPPPSVTSVGATESDFEEQVKERLEKLGFEVDSQVGVSGFRIDLAIRHPVRVGRYILGVECDGATYHRLLSARERDRLRQDVLERLGWVITRIWSPDWFRDPDRVVSRLLGEIEALQRAATIGVRADPRS